MWVTQEGDAEGGGLGPPQSKGVPLENLFNLHSACFCAACATVLLFGQIPLCKVEVTHAKGSGAQKFFFHKFVHVKTSNC